MSYETKCKSCGANIVMVQQTSGKWMPMDRAEECGDCLGTGRGDVRRPEVRCERCKGAGVIAISHFATCPNAAQHRKPKGKR